VDKRLVVAIGAGPSNLSFAALAQPQPELGVTVFESSVIAGWHPGLLVDGALMQTSYLKDLVTLVEPTSPYSFLAYLKDRGRLYRAIVRGLEHITRTEFQDYLSWAASRLRNVHFGEAVNAIEINRNLLRVSTERQNLHVDTIVVGVGRHPAVPEFAKPLLGKHVFHGSEFLSGKRHFAGQRIAVIGGGQSGAELVRELLRGTHGEPASVCWVSRRANLFSLEDSPFVNEWFFPQYSTWFQSHSPDVRKHLLSDQILASDGISSSTLKDIYELLYAREVEGRPGMPEFKICINTTIQAMSAERSGHRLILRDRITNDIADLHADIVILCTGYRNALPSFLEPLRGRISFVSGAKGEPEIEIRDDFSIVFDGPPDCRLYLQNGARTQYGIADPNLSLLAWRSARILNSIMRCERFDCSPTSSAIFWQHMHPEIERASAA